MHTKSKSAISLIMIVALTGCGDAWSNLTASLGGDTAGGRGEIGVIVLNNTPYKAVLTMGSYDQTGTNHPPEFEQFVLNGERELDPESDGGILSFECARVFSLGGTRLLEAIEAADADADPDALIEGIAFFDDTDTDPPANRGMARPFEALLGVDFPCNALLIFKLETDAGTPETFRVDFELIPSASTR